MGVQDRPSSSFLVPKLPLGNVRSAKLLLRHVSRDPSSRHQHPANRLLHGVGLPVTFVLPVILLIEGETAWAGASFVAGYLLQFAGHAIEGNDVGEVILVKKLAGMPYIDVVDPANRSSSEV